MLCANADEPAVVIGLIGVACECVACVPQSFDQAGGQAGEAIPMMWLAGHCSPGPSMACGGGGDSDFGGEVEENVEES